MPKGCAAAADDARRLDVLVDEPFDGEDELVVERRLRLLWQAADADVYPIEAPELLRSVRDEHGHHPGSETAVRDDVDAPGAGFLIEGQLGVDDGVVSAEVAEVAACLQRGPGQALVKPIVHATDGRGVLLHELHDRGVIADVELYRADLLGTDHGGDPVSLFREGVGDGDRGDVRLLDEIVDGTVTHAPGTEDEDVHHAWSVLEE